MDIRQAILKAADSIGLAPDQFEFRSCDIPDGCGTSGCALGWIAYHLGTCRFEGMIENQWNAEKLGKYMGLEKNNKAWAGWNFYERMNNFDGSWSNNANECAKALRAYADKYHPLTDHIPAEIRAIFEPVSEAA